MCARAGLTLVYCREKRIAVAPSHHVVLCGNYAGAQRGDKKGVRIGHLKDTMPELCRNYAGALRGGRLEQKMIDVNR